MIKQQEKVLKMKDDIMFKAFFSRVGHEEILKELLSAILGKNIKIKKVIHDARLEQLSKENKYGVLDLDVELENGEIINVEMQLRNYKNIEERTTFYAGKKISEQLSPKQDYDEIKKVIIIAILDYSFIKLPEYITDTVRVSKKHREYELNNDVEYIYIELEKFRKENPNMEEPLNQWLSFLDMERGDLLEMAMKKNKKVQEAMKYYDELTGDEEVKRLAEVRLMAKLEENSALSWAKKEGKRLGIQEGRKEGRKEGRQESKEEIAKKLLEFNIPIEQIVEATGLDKKEIEKLKSKQSKKIQREEKM